MNAFSYDVFLSFASVDEALVVPVWDMLSSSGLRVFWSDSSLKNEVGSSWFKAINAALINSRHFLVYCTENAMKSDWVEKECEVFFTQCYIKNQTTRKFIPFLSKSFTPNKLTPCLQTLQTCSVIDDAIKMLGGFNLKALNEEIESLQKKVIALQIENDSLKKQSIAPQVQPAITSKPVSPSLAEVVNKNPDIPCFSTVIEGNAEIGQLFDQNDTALNKVQKLPVKTSSGLLTEIFVGDIASLENLVKQDKGTGLPKATVKLKNGRRIDGDIMTYLNFRSDMGLIKLGYCVQPLTLELVNN